MIDNDAVAEGLPPDGRNNGCHHRRGPNPGTAAGWI